MKATTLVTNCRRNLMGTVSFDGQFPGMRKASDFIVYPMQDSTATIRIQSDNRFGQINLDTGKAVLSANSGSAHAGGNWLTICMMRGTAQHFTVDAEDVQTLRQWVKSSGGVLVGESFVKSDNTGALAL